MVIGEEQLKKLVLRILKELEEEQLHGQSPEFRRKLYMLATSGWDVRYQEFLAGMEQSGQYDIYPVIPESWRQMGYEAVFKKYQCCCQIRYHSDPIPADLEQTVTVFPVTDKDVVVKTALCISDTFETSWVADCMEYGSRIVLLRSGLKKFSGRESSAYVRQMLSYYRTILEYGVEIGSMDDLYAAVKDRYKPAPCGGAVPDQSGKLRERPEAGSRKKRVITASNVEQFGAGRILFLQPGDIITDLARDRAAFLNIVISEQDSEVIE